MATMSFRRHHRHLDVVCELQAGQLPARVEEWQRLRNDLCLGTESIPNGVRLWWPPHGRPVVEDLVDREAACCGFMDFELVVDGDRLRLDVTSPAPAAGPVLAGLAGHGDDEVASPG